MTAVSLITEDEAASLSGVSPVTLQRFADAGYLQVEQEKHGQRLFSRVEIERVFGLATGVQSVEAHSRTAETIIETPPASQMIEEPMKVVEAPTEKPHHVDREALRETDRELSRLSSVVALQEKYIELKEQELKNLREERDWLRTRIEKLEEKNDRDQLILVSVTETNRGLTKALENRRSTFKSALEWVGLLPTPPERQRGD